MTENSNQAMLRDYRRSMYRSQIVSLFWSVIIDRKKTGFTLQKLADALRIDKAQVSRWFNGMPNWEANSVADIADALNVDIQVTARDRATGKIYSATGSPGYATTISTPSQRGVGAPPPLTVAGHANFDEPFVTIA